MFSLILSIIQDDLFEAYIAKNLNLLRSLTNLKNNTVVVFKNQEKLKENLSWAVLIHYPSNIIHFSFLTKE